MWGRRLLCWGQAGGCPVHCGMLSSIPGFHLLDASNAHPLLWQSKTLGDTAESPHHPAENHRTRGVLSNSSAVHLMFWIFYPRLTAGNNNPPRHMSQVWRLNETVRKIRGYYLTQPHHPRTKPLYTLNRSASVPHAMTLLPFFWKALFPCLQQAKPYPFLKAQVKNGFPHEAFLHHLSFL